MVWILVLFCLPLAAQSGSPAARILVAYHSQTGNTEKLAMAVRDGAAAVKGVAVTLRKAAEATNDEISKADGLVVGTPVHWHNLSAGTKTFLDRVAEALGKNLGEGRTAGAFSTAGGGSGGQELARLSILSALLSMRFVIVGGVTDEGFGSLGPNAITAPKGVSVRDEAEARRFGERFARITLKLAQRP